MKITLSGDPNIQCEIKCDCGEHSKTDVEELNNILLSKDDATEVSINLNGFILEVSRVEENDSDIMTCSITCTKCGRNTTICGVE